MKQKQRLELTWIGKEKHPQLEPRILIENPVQSFGDPSTTNMLVQGDNLLALKALEQEFAGKVKCIYIDPPYNTGSAFEHYDDGIEHSLWLSLMRDRLVILQNLLSEDGSIWISIDDNECHYLKVMCDEIFGRKFFIANVLWQKRTSADARLRLGAAHDHLLVYGIKSSVSDSFNLIPLSEEQKKQYKNPDKDPRGDWVSTDFTAQGYRPNQMYEISTLHSTLYSPPPGRCWSNIESVFKSFRDDNRIWFGKNGDSRPRIKNFLSENKGVSSWTWWPNSEVGNNQESKKEINTLFGAENAFDTPKPERLIQRILHIATNPGDLILDSFLGSGTTAAVAHKMGRRWIGIELGDHCHTHCLPRLKQVCDGTDQGGISKAVDWKGGGGFKYYELAPSLLKKDPHNNWIISDEYNADMLAAAMAKHEAFTYYPDSEVYWKQGKSSEKDFIFTTTSFVQVAFIDRLHEEMQEDEHLLICCKKFSADCSDRYQNIEIKKIPKMLLGKCEFGRDDYSLNIVNMPVDEGVPEFVPQGPESTVKTKKKGRPNPAEQYLLDIGEES